RRVERAARPPRDASGRSRRRVVAIPAEDRRPAPASRRGRVTARASGSAAEDLLVRRRHRRIPGMRLISCVGVAAGALLIGDEIVHAIRARAIVPRPLELWTGYWLFLTATTWLHLSEN